jgi:hypothetical protein
MKPTIPRLISLIFTIALGVALSLLPNYDTSDRLIPPVNYCSDVVSAPTPLDLGSSTSQSSVELSRRNPDDWFTLALPGVIGKVERYADVDGGFYVSDNLKVGFDYWTYAGTPNWLRGKYLLLACSGKISAPYERELMERKR